MSYMKATLRAATCVLKRWRRFGYLGSWIFSSSLRSTDNERVCRLLQQCL